MHILYIYVFIYLCILYIFLLIMYIYIYIFKLSLYMDARIWKSIADQWQAAMKLYVQIAQVKT